MLNPFFALRSSYFFGLCTFGSTSCGIFFAKIDVFSANFENFRRKTAKFCRKSWNLFVKNFQTVVLTSTTYPDTYSAFELAKRSQSIDLFRWKILDFSAEFQIFCRKTPKFSRESWNLFVKNFQLVVLVSSTYPDTYSACK